jgi:excinuclease ABC subunit A
MASVKIAPPPDTLPRAIQARGVRHNTLRDLDVDVPLGQPAHPNGLDLARGQQKDPPTLGVCRGERAFEPLSRLTESNRRPTLTERHRP